MAVLVLRRLLLFSTFSKNHLERHSQAWWRHPCRVLLKFLLGEVNQDTVSQPALAFIAEQQKPLSSMSSYYRDPRDSDRDRSRHPRDRDDRPQYPPHPRDRRPAGGPSYGPSAHSQSRSEWEWEKERERERDRERDRYFEERERYEWEQQRRRRGEERYAAERADPRYGRGPAGTAYEDYRVPAPRRSRSPLQQPLQRSPPPVGVQLSPTHSRSSRPTSPPPRGDDLFSRRTSHLNESYNHARPPPAAPRTDEGIPTGPRASLNGAATAAPPTGPRNSFARRPPSGPPPIPASGPSQEARYGASQNSYSVDSSRRSSSYRDSAAPSNYDVGRYPLTDAVADVTVGNADASNRNRGEVFSAIVEGRMGGDAGVGGSGRPSWPSGGPQESTTSVPTMVPPEIEKRPSFAAESAAPPIVAAEPSLPAQAPVAGRLGHLLGQDMVHSACAELEAKAFNTTTARLRSDVELFKTPQYIALRQSLRNLADSDIELVGARTRTSVTEAALQRVREDAEAWSLECARIEASEKAMEPEAFFLPSTTSA